MACVVLLRVHLPPRFRIGVTAVLGEDRDFGFYVWWYEVVFVISTVFAAFYLWSEKRRKRIALVPLLTKANYERKFQGKRDLDDAEGAESGDFQRAIENWGFGPMSHSVFGDSSLLSSNSNRDDSSRYMRLNFFTPPRASPTSELSPDASSVSREA